MTTTPTSTPRHAITRVVGVVEDAVAEVTGASVWSMDPAEAAATLVRLTRLSARVAELELRVAEHARASEVGEGRGATSTENWWAHATNQTRRDAHAKMHLARAFDRYPLLHTGFTAGDVLEIQAQVIVRALDALPEDSEPSVRRLAEAHLVDLATDHDATALAKLGKRLLDVVDPAAGKAAEAKTLEAEERAARAKARLTMTDDGHGTTFGRFTIPTAQAAMLKKILIAIAAPKHVAATQGPSVERTPGPERMGAAFVELIERYPADRLPAAGGVSATVVVTMDLSTLMGGLGSASLDSGERITAAQARRLACEAGIIPAVLGATSQVLDLGRKTRFHTEAQRIALGIEQGGCTADGCDWPPAMCHAHHDTWWSRGGPTDLKTGRLLCPRHHARAHDPTFETTKLPGGKVAFTRRT